jgi:hypothetical protein
MIQNIGVSTDLQVPSRDQIFETAQAIQAAAQAMGVEVGSPFGPIPPRYSAGSETVALGIFRSLPADVRSGRIRSQVAFDMTRVAYLSKRLAKPRPAVPPEPQQSREQIWERTCARCPRVAGLMVQARRARKMRRANDNPWIQYEQFKRELSRLVGWDAPQSVPAEFRTPEVYSIAITELARNLGV